MRRDGNAEAGFALVELLVALVVTGLVVAAAHAALGLAADVWERSREEREISLAGATARTRMAEWLRAASLLEGAAPFVGGPQGNDFFPSHRLDFSVRDGGALYPGPHRIRLWVDRDPATPLSGLLAEVIPWHGSTLGLPDTVSLAPAALGLEVHYRMQRLGQLEWVPIWDSDESLPIGVRLQLLAPIPGAPYGEGVPPVLRRELTISLEEHEPT